MMAPMVGRGGDIITLVHRALAEPGWSWAIGAYGAIAEFARCEDDGATVTRAARGGTIVSRLGALRVAVGETARAIAYETPAAGSGLWTHAVAVCLSGRAAVMARRSTLAELGPDRDAIRARDRAGLVFDVGVGARAVDMCVRTNDPALIATLRRQAGRSVLAPHAPAMAAIKAASPHRLCVSRLGRIEVYQPIATAAPPEGPHTHLLPELLATGRAHGPGIPIPPRWLAGLYLFPPHPALDQLGHRKPFDADRHAAFQEILAQFGDPAFTAVKRRVAAAVGRGAPPDEAIEPPSGPTGQAVRVALRQLGVRDGPSPALDAWRAVYDPPA